MKQIGEAEFDAAIAKGPVLIDFSAEWCGPCKTMMPVIEKLANEYRGRLEVFTVDIDQDPALAARNGVMSVPTMIVIRDGKAVERVVGAVSERDLRSRIEPHLGA
ncbi:MAG TPA: thioredoxin [Thermoanaerobaculia bacterium]|nr:thioredoxin [Thermoanaerobaculia bacterium]